MSKTTKRLDGRRPGQLRPVKITPDFVGTADGSCLIEMGGTRVICTASVLPERPRWRDEGLGWVTAEYGMLPGSTPDRKARPLKKQDGRSVEIQRLIGRSLRGVVNFAKIADNTIYLDCDVLEADGGTRTASITGAQVALGRAIVRGTEAGLFARAAMTGRVAAVSVGIVDGVPMLDLNYAEDSSAEVDMNVVMTNGRKFIEVQGTSEAAPFDDEQLQQMLMLAKRGIGKLLRLQTAAIRGDVATLGTT